MKQQETDVASLYTHLFPFQWLYSSFKVRGTLHNLLYPSITNWFYYIYFIKKQFWIYSTQTRNEFLSYIKQTVFPLSPVIHPIGPLAFLPFIKKALAIVCKDRLLYINNKCITSALCCPLHHYISPSTYSEPMILPNNVITTCHFSYTLTINTPLYCFIPDATPFPNNNDSVIIYRTGRWWSSNKPDVTISAILTTIKRESFTMNEGRPSLVMTHILNDLFWCLEIQKTTKKMTPGLHSSTYPTSELLAYSEMNTLTQNPTEFLLPVIIQRRLLGPTIEDIIYHDNEHMSRYNTQDYFKWKIIVCLKALKQLNVLAHLGFRHNNLCPKTVCVDSCGSKYPIVLKHPLNIKFSQCQYTTYLIDENYPNICNPWYVSPEAHQLSVGVNTRRGIGHTSDVWSLGLTLVGCLLGKDISCICQDIGPLCFTKKKEKYIWAMPPDEWVEKIQCVLFPTLINDAFINAPFLTTAKSLFNTLITSKRYQRNLSTAINYLQAILNTLE